LIALCFNPYDLPDHRSTRCRKLPALNFFGRARACPLHLPAILISGFIRGTGDLESLIRPVRLLEKPFALARCWRCVRTLLNQGSPEIDESLLLYPRIPRHILEFQARLEIHRQTRKALPPLGLLTVAAMLPPAGKAPVI